MMPEYSVDVPLWPRTADTDALVAPGLLRRLIGWQQDFDRDFHYEYGWRTRDAMDRWSAEARTLEADLRAALPRGVVLRVDLWPLELDAVPPHS